MIRPGEGLPRWVEVPAALSGLVLVFPLLVVAGVVIILESPGGLLFRHRRVGRHGKPFVYYKLRSMRATDAELGVTGKGDTRITRSGRVIRKLKLDELPSLWNVVRGDMSLVGPRPEAERYVDLGDSRWQEVLRARPGITDPVTMELRNEEDLLAEVEGDVEIFYRRVLLPYKLDGGARYLRERTWQRDLRVLLATTFAILRPSSVRGPSIEQLLRETEPWES